MSGRHGRNEEDTVEGLRAQLDQVTTALAAALAELDRIGAAGVAVTADGTGPIARVQGPRAAGHRKDRSHLRLVKVWAVIAAGFGAIKAAMGAHRVLTVGLAAMVAVPTVTATATHGSQVIPFVASPPASVLGPAWRTQGTPIPLPVASMLAVTRPKTAVTRSRPLVALTPPCPAPVSPSPSPSSPSPSPSSSDPQPSWTPQQTQPSYPGGGYGHRHRDWHSGQPGWQSSDPPTTPADTTTPTAPATGTPATDPSATSIPAPASS